MEHTSYKQKLLEKIETFSLSELRVEFKICAKDITANCSEGEIKDIIDKIRLGIIDEPLTVALLHKQADFLFRVGILPLGGRLKAHAPSDPVGYMVEQPDKRVHELVEDQHRQGHGQHDLLDTLDGHGLRGELTQDDVASRDDGERQHQRDRMPDRRIDAHCLRDRQDQHGHSRLADPAQSQRGPRDAQLRDRQRRIQMVGEPLSINRPPASLRNQGFQSGGTDFHAGKLCRHKKAVHKD